VHEAEVQALNQWIRTSGAFDGVVDADLVLRDPAQPNRLLPAYDSGDHLHPNTTGGRAVANAIDLRLLR
jgi:lysophospholipase L1-like esterase